jgi:hypothetical protein
MRFEPAPGSALPPCSTVAKRVALRLRGLSAADRQWLLARLSKEQRDAVEQASDELRQIVGSAQLDFALILDAMDAHAVPQSHAVNEAGFAAVQWVLARLPQQYMAIFLHSNLWRDAAQYLRQMSPRRRKAVEAGNERMPTPRVLQAMADVIAEIAAERQADDHG